MKILSGKKPSTAATNCQSSALDSASETGCSSNCNFKPIVAKKIDTLDPLQLELKSSNESKESIKGTSNITKMNADGNIYHEKQSRAMCALHALNNLFQEESFSKEELDKICEDLSPSTWWVNPHKSVLGLGNYDINVLIKALERDGYEVVWFNKKKNLSDINLSAVFGFILNVPTDTRVGWLSLPLKRKHWFSIRQIGELYYNLDSKLEKPGLIGTAPDLIAYLQNETLCNDKELLLVVSKEVSESEAWKNNQSASHIPSTSSANATANISSDSSTPNNPHIVAGTNSQKRKESFDSGVVELLDGVNGDLNIVDCNQEDERRYSP